MHKSLPIMGNGARASQVSQSSSALDRNAQPIVGKINLEDRGL
jgi:hypothetical protein